MCACKDRRRKSVETFYSKRRRRYRKSQGIKKVIRIHHLGTMNVSTKFQSILLVWRDLTGYVNNWSTTALPLGFIVHEHLYAFHGNWSNSCRDILVYLNILVNGGPIDWLADIAIPRATPLSNNRKKLWTVELVNICSQNAIQWVWNALYLIRVSRSRNDSFSMQDQDYIGWLKGWIYIKTFLCAAWISIKRWVQRVCSPVWSVTYALFSLLFS